MSLSEVTVPFQNSFDLGIGLDSRNASPMGMAIQGKASQVDLASGATVRFEINRIKSTAELEDKLDITAQASYAAGPFADVSGRFGFAQSSKIEKSSLSFAITSIIKLAHVSINEPQLTPEASSLVDNSLIFQSKFGDMFVRGLDRGGYFCAVMKLSTKDSDQAQEISASLSGAYALFSAEAKTKFDKIQNDHQSEVSISVYHEGGPLGLIMNTLNDPSQFYAMFQTWLKSFVDDPNHMAVPYAATLAPIAIANGPLPPNANDDEFARDVLVRCAKERSECLDNLNMMDVIIQAPTHYTFTAPVSIASITDAARGYQEDLQLIHAAASATMNHPSSAKLPAAYAADTKQAYPQGIRPDPMPALNLGQLSALAARGEQLVLGDSLLIAMRDLEPVGPGRKGFEIGLAVAEDDSLQGPMKDQFGKDHINDFDPDAYRRGIDFMVDRNANADLAGRGSTAVAAKPEATAARAKLAVGIKWLGFNIGAGLFGSAADGAVGNTLRGPGSNKIRESLSGASRIGFDAALSFYKVP